MEVFDWVFEIRDPGECRLDKQFVCSTRRMLIYFETPDWPDFLHVVEALRPYDDTWADNPADIPWGLILARGPYEPDQGRIVILTPMVDEEARQLIAKAFSVPRWQYGDDLSKRYSEYEVYAEQRFVGAVAEICRSITFGL